MVKQIPYLLFKLNKELFGIRVENVIRVINLEKLMKVPKAPSFIAGAITVEGDVIPVIDLAKKIELGETTIEKKTKVIVLQVIHHEETLLVGALIDEVLDVVEVHNTKLLPPVLDSMGFDTQTLDGMYKVNDDFYMILNVEKVFEKELATFI
jgi:purine-binding chemotaxis protein CheW